MNRSLDRYLEPPPEDEPTPDEWESLLGHTIDDAYTDRHIILDAGLVEDHGALAVEVRTVSAMVTHPFTDVALERVIWEGSEIFDTIDDLTTWLDERWPVSTERSTP